MLELEGGGQTIPTVIALGLMYLSSALLGRDLAGSMYRYAAYEMLKRLHLERKFSKLTDDSEDALTKRMLSRTLWGLLCFEKYV